MNVAACYFRHVCGYVTVENEIQLKLDLAKNRNLFKPMFADNYNNFFIVDKSVTSVTDVPHFASGVQQIKNKCIHYLSGIATNLTPFTIKNSAIPRLMVKGFE